MARMDKKRQSIVDEVDFAPHEIVVPHGIFSLTLVRETDFAVKDSNGTTLNKKAEYDLIWKDIKGRNSRLVATIHLDIP